MDSSLYPCTWGTFATMALCMAQLPPGSQAAARDEAEAYRTMPLHPSQWNGTVVRVGDDAFNLDTCLLFGLAPSAGIYGACADAANDIMRAEGIGPIVKWVDDKVFFRLPKPALTSFNATRAQLCTEIAKNGARHHEGGRWWYHAGLLQDGRIIECDEDTVFPLKDLSNASPRSAYEASFTYSMADIDRIAVPMGIPCDWERSKDIPFGTVIHYIGLEWDIARHTVALPHGKREKYRAAISHHAHARPGAEPLWQAAPHYPGGSGLPNASGKFHGHWGAWRLTALTGDWQSQGRAIGWAEAVGFELLTHTLITLYGPDSNLKCFSDNTGVVEGWWKDGGRAPAKMPKPTT